MLQNFKPYETAKVIEVQTVQVPKKDDKGNPVNDAKGNPVMVDQKVDSQSIVEGPIASQIAIKMLGTNGGGYMNAKPPILLRTQRRFPILFRCYPSLRFLAR